MFIGSHCNVFLLSLFLSSGVSAAVAKTAAAPIERIKVRSDFHFFFPLFLWLEVGTWYLDLALTIHLCDPSAASPESG